MIDRAGAADEVGQLVRELALELGVLAVVSVGGFEFIERVDQGLGHETATVNAKVSLGIGLLISHVVLLSAGAVCGANGCAELLDQAGVLDAFGGLNARTYVNGPGPQLKHASRHISGMQPTRQNDWTGQHGGLNERPIENLSTATIALDVGVEQDGLGVLKTRREV